VARPNRDGKVSGFTAPRMADEPGSEMTTPVGKGDASPVLAGENLYAFGRQEADEVVLCLDATSGKTIWEAKYPAAGLSPARRPASGPRSTPAVAGERFARLGLEGPVLLRCRQGHAALAQTVHQRLSGASTKSDSSMSPWSWTAAASSMSVKEPTGPSSLSIWLVASQMEIERRWPGDSSPVVLTVGGKKQLVTLAAKNLVGLDLANGTLLWQVPFEATQGNNTTPVVAGSTIIYTGQAKGCSL